MDTEKSKTPGYSANCFANWTGGYIFFFYSREVCEIYASYEYRTLGGKGKTIELDRTVLTSRKYNLGRITSSMTQSIFGIWCWEDKEGFDSFEFLGFDLNINFNSNTATMTTTKHQLTVLISVCFTICIGHGYLLCPPDVSPTYFDYPECNFGTS